MKVKRILIQNIGKIKNEMIELNKPLILFYGEIRQGKTTILNCVRWVMGGTFPEDIIRHGEEEGNILLEMDNGSITREFYKSKTGIATARPLAFIQNGKAVKKPVDEIKKFLNPFLLDQDYLRKMTETERKAYFVELFGVDTSEIDQKIEKAATEAKSLRDKIKGYGEIDLTEVKSIPIEPIKRELTVIRNDYQKTIAGIDRQNKEILAHNMAVDNMTKDYEYFIEEAIKLEAQIKTLTERKDAMVKKGDECKTWISKNPKKDEVPKPNLPDTSALETQISEAAANEVRYEQYQKNIERAEAKAADEKKVSELETNQRECKKEKIAKLSKIGEVSGIKTLMFDETGNFIYEETTAGMLSGSQIMKLSEELSNLYPKDLGLGLVDRAESLGKSVFLLVDRAKEEEKTILATVVGERPANIPEEIGVFIVEEGEIKK